MLNKLLAVLFISFSLSTHAVPLNTQLLTNGDFSIRNSCRLTSNCYYPVYWLLSNTNSAGAFTLSTGMNNTNGLKFTVSSIKPGGSSSVYQWQQTKVDPYGTYEFSVNSRCNVPLILRVNYTNSLTKVSTGLELGTVPFSNPLGSWAKTTGTFFLPRSTSTVVANRLSK